MSEMIRALQAERVGGTYELLRLVEVPKPTPLNGELLVKINAASINPIDFKLAKYGWYVQEWPAGFGCDMAGTVESVGDNVTDFKVGDEVFGYTRVGTPGTATWSEFCRIPGYVCGRRPSGISAAQAAALPLGTLTAFAGICHAWGLPFPTLNTENERGFLLIMGGASSVGQYAIQIGKLLGFTVVTTASPDNFELLKGLGASHVINYHDIDVEDQLRSIVGNHLTHAFDTVSPATAQVAANLMSTQETGMLSTIAGGPTSLPGNIKHIQVNSALGYVDASGADWVHSYYAELTTLVESGKIVPNPIEILPNGLVGIPDGVKLMAEGKISAKKLVVLLGDTPSL